MSETKFTPGPWIATGSLVSTANATIANCSLDHLKIAARLEFYSGDKQTEQNREIYLQNRLEIDDTEMANTKLMAAAPDLLQCLIDCVENILIDFPDDDERKVKYVKAIAKAT